VDGNDTVDIGKGWKKDTSGKQKDGVIRLIKDDGSAVTIHTKATKDADGKKQNASVTLGDEELNAPKTIFGDPASSDATGDSISDDDLKAQLKTEDGKSRSAEELATTLDKAKTAGITLTPDQKKMVAQQYALQYTKEHPPAGMAQDKVDKLTVGDLTQTDLDAAKSAAKTKTGKPTDPIYEDNDLSKEIGNLKSAGVGTSAEMITKLKAGQLTIDKDNVDKVDFAEIAKLPKDERQRVMRNMQFSDNLSEQQKDKLTLKFMQVCSNKFADEMNVSRGDADLDDDTMTPDDLEKMKEVAGTSFTGASFITDKIHNMAEHTKNLGLAASGESRYGLKKNDFTQVLALLGTDPNKTLQQIIDAEKGKGSNLTS
jgi:hypothetical protein